MPASNPLYHEIRTHIRRHCPEADVPVSAADRLALLVTGLLAAQSCVLTKVAIELAVLRLTAALVVESIGRRLRRTLNDPALTAAQCYTPLLPRVLGWTGPASAGQRITLILDESSHTDHIHLFRLSLPYRGGAIPLAWAVWEQNVALPDGTYWQEVDAVLATVAGLLPPGAEVVVVGDRAFAVPALLDRLAARGWHWVLRLTTTGSHRFCPDGGTELALSTAVQRHLGRPGTRWRTRGELFKDAGWRAVAPDLPGYGDTPLGDSTGTWEEHVAALDRDGTPLAETWRKVVAAAWGLGFAPPGYHLTRRLVHEERRRRRDGTATRTYAVTAALGLGWSRRAGAVGMRVGVVSSGRKLVTRQHKPR